MYNRLCVVVSGVEEPVCVADGNRRRSNRTALPHRFRQGSGAGASVDVCTRYQSQVLNIEVHTPLLFVVVRYQCYIVLKRTICWCCRCCRCCRLSFRLFVCFPFKRSGGKMQLQLFDKNTNIYESQVWATLMPVLVRVTRPRPSTRWSSRRMLVGWPRGVRLSYVRRTRRGCRAWLEDAQLEERPS